MSDRMSWTDVRWELLMPDGRIVAGEGQDAPAGMKLSTLAKDALHARFVHPAGTTVYVAGSTELRWTVQHIFAAGKEAARHRLPQRCKALGLSTKEGGKVWIMPNGELGIGRTVEEVGVAFREFAMARARRM